MRYHSLILLLALTGSLPLSAAGPHSPARPNFSGLRVPFVARWPGRIPAASRSDYAGLIFDLFPTCLELAGRPLAGDVDAVSLVPVLQGKTISGPRDLYFVYRNSERFGGKSCEALICGGWKQVQNSPFRPFELYHLEADPQETNDLPHVPEHSNTFDSLAAALRGHIQRGGAVPWQPPHAALHSARP